MKVLKIIGNCLFGFVSIVLLFLLFLGFANKDEDVSKIGNYSLLHVQGTSMKPSIKNGDLIVIDRRSKDKYEVGDVVSFRMSDGTIITHEIVKVEIDDEYRYFTKGTNNNYQDNDYVQIKQIIGEYKGIRVPLLGYVVGFANSGIGYWLLIVVPLGLVLVCVTRELIKEVLKKKGEV